MAQEVNLLGLILDIKDNATPYLKSFSNSIRLAGREVNKFSKDFDEMEASIGKSTKKTSGLLKSMFTETKDTMERVLNDSDSHVIMAQTNLGNRMQARHDEFNKRMADQSAKLHRTIMGSVALSMSGVSAMNFSRPIVQGFGEMIKQAGEFSETMKKIQLATADFNGQMSDALDKSNKMISKTVMSAGIASPLSPKETAEMANSLATMGFHDAKSLNSLIAPAMLMQANSATEADGGLSPTQASQLVSNLVIQMGKGIGSTKNMKLAGQDFEGVSQNGLSINNMVMKSLHDAHLTSTDVLGFQSSAGSALATSGMSLPDFLAIGGAMKREGIQVRTGGRDIQGLVNRAGLFDAQNATKPTALSKQAEEIGLTMSNLKGGNFLEKLTTVYDKALQLYGSKAPEVLGRLANSTGKNVFTAIENLDKERKAGNIEMNATEMSKDIARAGVEGDGAGYAEKRFNELSQQFPLAWKQFTGSLAGLGQIIGGSVLPPITKLVIKLTELTGKLMEFAQAHPLITKILGIGGGLAGLLMLAGGAALYFGGQIISMVASVNNFRVQMAMATGTVEDFRRGSLSAQMLLGEKGLTNVFGGLALKVLGFTAAIGAGYMIWQNDIGGIKTLVLDLKAKVTEAFSHMQGMIQGFEEGNSDTFLKQRMHLKASAGDWYQFARFLVDATLVFKSVVKYWSTEMIPADKFKLLEDEGLIPLLDTIFKLKHEGKAFFDGFKKGFSGFIEDTKAVLSPFLAMAKPILKFFHLDGLFEQGGKPNVEFAESFGEGVGKIVKWVAIGLIAFRAYSKAIKSILGIYGKAKNMAGAFQVNGFKGIGQEVLKGIGWGISKSKGLLVKALGKDTMELGRMLRAELSRAMDFRKLEKFSKGGYAGGGRVRTPVAVFGKPRKGTHKNDDDNYRQFWNDNFPHMTPRKVSPTIPTRPKLSASEVRELESMQAFATSKTRRDLAARALDAHHRGALNSDMGDIRRAYEKEDHKFLRTKKGKNTLGFMSSGIRMAGSGMSKGLGFLGRGALGTGKLALKGGKLALTGMKNAGSLALKGAKGAGSLALKGGKTLGKLGLKGLGGAGMALGMLSNAGDIIDGFKEGGIGGGLSALGGTLGIGAKGGMGGAMSGAMSGAGIGMMFGPIGAVVGAAIGGALGGIGMDKIKEGVKKAGEWVGTWWKGLVESDMGKTLSNMFKNSFDTFLTIGKDYITLLKDVFTGNWSNIGKDIGKIWVDFYNGFKKQIGFIWGYLKETTIGKWVSKIMGLDGDIKPPTFAPGESDGHNEIDGDHASGLPYVPYNDYRANLHKGEMVLTENDANAFRKAQTASAPDSSGGGSNVVFEKGSVQISMANSSPAEIERAADELFKKFLKKIENKNIANYQPSRMRGSMG